MGEQKVSDPWELELKTFAGGPASYMGAGFQTLVRILMYQVLLIVEWSLQGHSTNIIFVESLD